MTKQSEILAEHRSYCLLCQSDALEDIEKAYISGDSALALAEEYCPANTDTEKFYRDILLHARLFGWESRVKAATYARRIIDRSKVMRRKADEISDSLIAQALSTLAKVTGEEKSTLDVNLQQEHVVKKQLANALRQLGYSDSDIERVLASGIPLTQHADDVLHDVTVAVANLQREQDGRNDARD